MSANRLKILDGPCRGKKLHMPFLTEEIISLQSLTADATVNWGGSVRKLKDVSGAVEAEKLVDHIAGLYSRKREDIEGEITLNALLSESSRLIEWTGDDLNRLQLLLLRSSLYAVQRNYSEAFDDIETIFGYPKILGNCPKLKQVVMHNRAVLSLYLKGGDALQHFLDAYNFGKLRNEHLPQTLDAMYLILNEAEQAGVNERDLLYPSLAQINQDLLGASLFAAVGDDHWVEDLVPGRSQGIYQSGIGVAMSLEPARSVSLIAGQVAAKKESEDFNLRKIRNEYQKICGIAGSDPYKAVRILAETALQHKGKAYRTYESINDFNNAKAAINESLIQRQDLWHRKFANCVDSFEASLETSNESRLMDLIKKSLEQLREATEKLQETLVPELEYFDPQRAIRDASEWAASQKWHDRRTDLLVKGFYEPRAQLFSDPADPVKSMPQKLKEARKAWHDRILSQPPWKSKSNEILAWRSWARSYWAALMAEFCINEIQALIVKEPDAFQKDDSVATAVLGLLTEARRNYGELQSRKSSMGDGEDSLWDPIDVDILKMARERFYEISAHGFDQAVERFSVLSKVEREKRRLLTKNAKSFPKDMVAPDASVVAEFMDAFAKYIDTAYGEVRIDFDDLQYEEMRAIADYLEEVTSPRKGDQAIMDYNQLRSVVVGCKGWMMIKENQDLESSGGWNPSVYQEIEMCMEESLAHDPRSPLAIYGLAHLACLKAELPPHQLTLLMYAFGNTNQALGQLQIPADLPKLQAAIQSSSATSPSAGGQSTGTVSGSAAPSAPSVFIKDYVTAGRLEELKTALNNYNGSQSGSQPPAGGGPATVRPGSSSGGGVRRVLRFFGIGRN